MIYNKDNIKQAILDIVKSEEYSDLTKYASSNISKILTTLFASFFTLIQSFHFFKLLLFLYFLAHIFSLHQFQKT